MTAPRRRSTAPPTRQTPISTVLREQIHAQDLSSYALGQATGVDQRNIRRFLLGQSDLSVSSADRIAAALGLQLITTPTRKGGPRGSPRPSPPIEPAHDLDTRDEPSPP